MKLQKKLWVAVLMIVLAASYLFLYHQNAAALPEYSAQTGEPCASCHLSPSGGGPRGPRGQAWVGSGKPGTVPALTDALELLGIHLEVDESRYEPPIAPPPAAELRSNLEQKPATSLDENLPAEFRRSLKLHDGN